MRLTVPVLRGIVRATALYRAELNDEINDGNATQKEWDMNERANSWAHEQLEKRGKPMTPEAPHA